eukprot:PhM_4_TR14859/c0_g1_i2/m.26161/K13249/SSR1; translocon-associated protein subunit alpha
MSLRLFWLCLVLGLLIGAVFADEAVDADTDAPEVDDVEEDDGKKSTEAASITTTCLFPDYPEGSAIPTGDYVEAVDADTDAPEVDDVEEDDGKKSTEAAGVTTTCLFPDYPEGSAIPTGDYVEALVGMNNAADVTYRAEYVVAYLLNPNPMFYIQNFSGAVYGRSVSAGETATLKYRFKPDAQLDPRDYNLVVQVFYMNDDNETFLASAFNSTVTLAEPVTTMDAQTIFSYASLLGVVGLLVYFA